MITKDQERTDKALSAINRTISKLRGAAGRKQAAADAALAAVREAEQKRHDIIFAYLRANIDAHSIRWSKQKASSP